MADALNQEPPGSLGKRGQRLVAGLAVADSDLDLYEFVMIKCRVEFGDDSRCDTGCARRHDRFEIVTEFAQVFFLADAEVHGIGVVPDRTGW